jgi:hypothetical protein
LFTASSNSLAEIRKTVAGLLVERQSDVQEVAASTVLPLIQDSPLASVFEMRDEFVTYLRSTGDEEDMVG